MDKRIENFKLILKDVERQYFENRNESDFDNRKIVPFISEMDTTDLVGDKLIWLN